MLHAESERRRDPFDFGLGGPVRARWRLTAHIGGSIQPGCRRCTQTSVASAPRLSAALVGASADRPRRHD
jgi:hypothetical protein